ncbi:hypothetical protein [Streptomyces sp. NPDC048521]|uniref:hypothetical protein n=1 Tax=Streptomyces sp. NPDC048521 TaxID=3365566 RepID=UPI00371F1768
MIVFQHPVFWYNTTPLFKQWYRTGTDQDRDPGVCRARAGRGRTAAPSRRGRRQRGQPKR